MAWDHLLPVMGPPVRVNAACSINFDHRLTGIADGRGIRVALLSPRRLANRVDIATFPQGVSPVQSRCGRSPGTPQT